MTAAVAAIGLAAVDSVDLPAVRGGVLVWVVVWFVLGYALYAAVYGALGSLASRPEDAQSVTGPVTVTLLAAYWAAFLAIGSPESGWARFVSMFPPTAPLAMPGRIAMGAAAWWEPALAVALTLAAIAALVQFAGRVYAGAVLHTGPALKLRDAWRDTTRLGPSAGPSAVEAGMRHTGTRQLAAPATARVTPRSTTTSETTDRWTNGTLIAIGLGIGVAVAVLAGDVVLGLAVGAAFYAVAARIAKARAVRDERHGSHP